MTCVLKNKSHRFFFSGEGREMGRLSLTAAVPDPGLHPFFFLVSRKIAFHKGIFRETTNKSASFRSLLRQATKKRVSSRSVLRTGRDPFVFGLGKFLCVKKRNPYLNHTVSMRSHDLIRLNTLKVQILNCRLVT